MDSKYFKSNFYENSVDVNSNLVTRDYLSCFYTEMAPQEKSNKLWIWGNLKCGVGGAGVEEEVLTTPRAVRNCGGMWTDVHIANNCNNKKYVAMALTNNGNMYLWGKTHPNLLGNGAITSTNQTTPFLSRAASNTATYVKIGKGHSTETLSVIAEISSNNDTVVNMVGENGYYQFGNGLTTDSATWVTPSVCCRKYTKVSITEISETNSQVPRSHFLLYCTPNNNANKRLYHWSLGNGSSSTQPGMGDQYTDFCATRCGVFKLYDSSAFGSRIFLIYCGYNICGVSGEATETPNSNTFISNAGVSLPTTSIWIPYVTDGYPNVIKSFTAGTCSAFAILADGSLWAWGSNYYGQLGIGTSLNTISCPTQVGSEKSWRYITTSPEGDSVAAIKTDGSLWVWGRSSYIEGNGSVTQDRCSPVQAAIGRKNWVKLSLAEDVIAGITEEDL